MKKTNPYTIRSFLFSPAIKPDFIQKILGLTGEDKPDAIIFDLEDSVAVNNKDEAREFLLNNLYRDKLTRKALFDNFKIFVRLNKYQTRWFKEDVKAIKLIEPDFVRFAKVETTEEIKYIRKMMPEAQIAVCIESLKGFSNLNAIMRELKPGDIFNIGYEDLSGELMIERPDRLDLPNPLTTILHACIIQAREHQITIIDSVSRKFKTEENLQNLEKECIFTKSIGLTGKTAIHPSQVPVINKVFNKEALIKNAQEGINQFQKLTDGTFVIVGENSEMKDTPSYKMYNSILEKYKDYDEH